MKDVRVDGLAIWARSTDRSIPDSAELTPVSDDASFRRYFRFNGEASGKVFVDAPPEYEDNESFVRVADALGRAGLNCPEVLNASLELGYLVITDLGDRVYLDEMRSFPEHIDALYDEAVNALLRMLEVDCDLPHYDEAKLRQEMSLFHEWFLPQQLNMEVDGKLMAMLEPVYSLLVDNALMQPQRFVHRDYHCRNLMVMSEDGPGILDFQDAVIGPVTYDMVSLYKDCYYRFERSVVVDAVQKFRDRLLQRDLVQKQDPVLRWFDLMGAQRHLKCAGIFSRLNLRDGKSGYLPDIPLVIDYLIEVAGLYPELAEFSRWLSDEIVPRLRQPEFRR
ncbi:MAG: phosphotransferase [Gammaproteobacteria bacterium]|jgi:N-acetylmuramate 1-kinase|nr:phosphotransferase [Gammaproteobacteria bacterium]MBT4494810.1 phosphotransferase [Gammaproteobacteria bacterium]